MDQSSIEAAVREAATQMESELELVHKELKNFRKDFAWAIGIFGLVIIIMLASIIGKLP